MKQRMTRKKRTIIISNRLPIRIEKKDNELQFIPSEGGLATGLGSIYKNEGNIWVGWPGYVPQNEKEKNTIAKKLREMNLIPVFLTEKQIEGFYEGFSNEILWPIFHYRLSYAIYDEKYWTTYKEVNALFLREALNCDIQPKDEIWVHDYQLMLLPQLLREKKQELSISYFQHIPFPPDEIFRCIPWRKELLNGLLGADLIGFHTFTDAKHFKNACHSLLQLAYKNNILHTRNRDIFVEIFPMGIDFQKFSNLAQQSEVLYKSEEIKKSFDHRKLILSVDRLDYSKGILMRIQGFEKLLETYPNLHNKVILYMLVVPSRDTVHQYKTLLDEIDRRVGHINSIYGDNNWRPIVYFYHSIPVEDLSALYVAADICLVSSLRDGMNLVSKEYIASKAHSKKGVLILSELAGASKELTESLLINPHSINEVMQAIYLALHMPDSEQKSRMASNLEIVKEFDIYRWIRVFFLRFREIKRVQKKHTAKKLSDTIKPHLLAEYAHAQKRLFLLDYDGTLVGFHKDAAKALPAPHLLDTLNQLKNDKKNTVIVISGRAKDDLHNWLSDHVHFLIGEHGVKSNFPNGEWHQEEDLNTLWKNPVRRIMRHLTRLTPGTYLEEKDFSLAWHYRRADPDLASLRSRELAERLQYLISQYNLKLLDGDKVIEVKNAVLSKGTAAKKLINELKPDFIVAMGDDVTDEDMFYELPSSAFSIKIGTERSAAKYYLESQEKVSDFLESFLNHKK